MAILILDDETHTREALRVQLTSLGHRTIVEARSPREALRLMAHYRSRIQMILADLNPEGTSRGASEAREFLTRIHEVPQAQLSPILQISSYREGALVVRGEPRLSKSFGARQLEKQMALAHAWQARRRATVLYQGEARADLADAIQAGGRWNRLWHLPSGQALGAAHEAGLRECGLVLLAPEARLDPQWIQQFKKSGLGAATPFVFLSRDPAHAFPVRTQCQFFVPSPTGAAWRPLLADLAHHIDQSWLTGLLAAQAKVALRRWHDGETATPALAERDLKRILRQDRLHAEAATLLGEITHDPALLRRAIALNPSHPRSHLKLLALLAARRAPAAELVADARVAADFCPGNVDVLIAAARACEAGGDARAAREIATRARPPQRELHPHRQAGT
jgi:CheY-like chemotaxis protein